MDKQMNCFGQLPGRAIFSTRMSAKARLAFGIAAALPLFAPYELLMRPGWPDDLGPAWLFALIVSIGAIVVSISLLVCAVFGINRRVEFDVGGRVVRVKASHLMQKEWEANYPFSEIIGLEVVCHDWSDGASTFEIRLTPGVGKPFAFGDFASRTEAESALASVCALMGRS